MIKINEKQTLVMIATLTIIFTLVSIFWVFLSVNENVSDSALELFSGTYGVLALAGSIFAIRISKALGGTKSLYGKVLFYYALGLLAQVFGQVSYSLYTYIFSKEIPYPSIGDVGYMGSVLLYIVATYLLVKATTPKASLHSYFGRLQAIIIPLAMLVFSYVEFLNGYEFDWSNPVATILDFAYPFGQAIYVSLAILALSLSWRFLGGRMRPIILFLLAALVVQYIADFMFLYQTSRDTWTTGGINDYIYAASYFLMSVSLVRFSTILHITSNSTSEAKK